MQKMTTKKGIFYKFSKMPIGNKITLMYATVFSILLILSTIFIMLNVWYIYHGVSKKELYETIDNVEDYIKGGGEINKEAIAKINPNRFIEIRVIDLSNHNRFETMFNPHMYPPPINEYNTSNDKNFDKDIDVISIKKKYYMTDEKKIEYNGKRYLIQVFRPNEYERRFIYSYSVIFLIVNVMGIIIAFGIGKFISRKLLMPIKEINETAERISIHDLSQRINVPAADDEIRTLALTFNDMISRLEVSFEKQKRFISDASHELRTPISVIQGYANLIDRWGKSDPEVLQEAIDSIKDETKHISALIKKLLFLAKEEKNLKYAQKKVICLNDIINEIQKEKNVLEIEKNIETKMDEDLFIMGDSYLIKEMLWIFIENAVKYSDKKNGNILISAFLENEKIVLSVKDNGIGIADDEQGNIWKRFYRASNAKGIYDNKSTGLGLSIVKKIAELHGGVITVESQVGIGSIFTLILKKKSIRVKR